MVYSPEPGIGFYWPRKLERSLRIEVLARLYRDIGYEPCQPDLHEPGYEKVALFALEGEVTHAARQLPNGRWTSKLGTDHDIEHDLHALVSETDGGYGTVVQVLKRKAGQAG